MNQQAHDFQMCDECGKDVAKIWRVHKGHKFCSTCYARVFKRRMCPKCGNFAKLPKNDVSAVCLSCEVDKPCARCGAVEYSVGKITPYGPVCNSCSPYFRIKEPCEICGVLSSKLSRVSRFDHEKRVCQKCARADHGNCGACHRCRLLEQSPDGRLLCHTCLTVGEVPCPQCNQSMPAGRKRQCESCYWQELLRKRISMDRTGFSVPSMALHFSNFGEWLGEKIGTHKAAITLHRYFSFFVDIEKQWQAIPEYAMLLKYFGTPGLRKMLLPMKWMQEAGFVAPDAAAKAEDSDQRRVAATLGKFKAGTAQRVILAGYHDHLLAGQKEGKITWRSVRLAMTPAAALLLYAATKEVCPPDQKMLNAYLDKTPGQRAAVSGFVGFLRDSHKVSITLTPANDKATKTKKKRLEEEFLRLLAENDRSQAAQLKLLAVAMAYFHGVTHKEITGDVFKNVTPFGEGLNVKLHEKVYWLPLPQLTNL
jgi:hypothetical protein